ncbi:hypothetical protein TNCV_919361 [Trichonephila clavipes]|nr:hypothetical protein TNCV_919361 [Trichonephila clavipes]
MYRRHDGIAVLADPTRVLPRGAGWPWKCLKMTFLSNSCCMPTSIILLENCFLGNHLAVLHGVEEYHQRNVGPLRFYASQLKWTVYHRRWPLRPLHQLCGQCDLVQCGGNCTTHQGASTPVHGYHVSLKQTGIHH